LLSFFSKRRDFSTIRYKIEQYFNPGHVHKPKFGLSICDVGMSLIFKPDHCMERPSLVLLSTYQEYLMIFKLMTSQVVQRARPLITHVCVIGAQRVNSVKVHLTPKIFFTRMNLLIIWNSSAKKFLNSVKSSIFCATTKYRK